MNEASSLRPMTAPNRAPQNVAEFIQRVNTQLPGGFRSLNHDDIKSRVAARQMETEDDDENDDSSETDEKTMLQVRDEILGGNVQAQQCVHLTLEFVSLLLSKETPTIVQSTISEDTRKNIGLGTLGVTMLNAPTTLTRSRVPDNKLTAMGKRLMDVNKAADSALAAAKRLRGEMEKETKYWSETLAVSESGWSTFRHPREPHSMAVKFGFSNASPELKANSVATLRKSEDGSVWLAYGKMGEESKRVQVSIISRNGEVVGRSSLPQPLPEDAPFQDRVKDARDNLFARELWHELNRESRSLVGHNVRPENPLGDAPLLYTGDPERTISLRLVTIDGHRDGAGPVGSKSEDATAEAIHIALHILLSNAHRVNENRRSEPVPTKAQRVTPPYHLFLPIITYLQHEQKLARCTRFLATLTSVLRSAGLPASCAITEAPLSTRRHAPPSESLVASLLRPCEVQFDVLMTPASRLRILARSIPYTFTTGFLVYLLPAADGGTNSLTHVFPPSTRTDPRAGPAADSFYPDTTELFWYLFGAVPRALLQHFRSLIHHLDTGSTTWVGQFGDKGLVDGATGRFGLRFDVPWREDGEFELVVEGSYIDQGKTVARTWKWSAQGPCHEEGSLDGLVRRVLTNGPGS